MPQKVSGQTQTPVLVLPVRAEARQQKSVPCQRSAILALPPGSGDWRVEGVPGLYVRVGAKSRTFRLQRRVDGRLAVRVLGDLERLTPAEARRLATRQWQTLKPAPPDGRITLEQALVTYLNEKRLAPRTAKIYSYDIRRYLPDWLGKPLEALGRDRAGFRSRLLRISREHGQAVAVQVLGCVRAVYNYHRRVLLDLPECPAVAVDLTRVRPRDWALSDEELRAWWSAVQRLQPLKQALWLTLLLTGARADSVRMLKWEDVDFERRAIRFSTAKAGRCYSVPMVAALEAILSRWRETAPPSEWVFPSPRRSEMPLAGKIRDDKRGVVSAHHLRHTMRTRLAEVGATPDLARIALGHSMTGDVSSGYITPKLLVEAVRPLMEAVAQRYAEVLEWNKGTGAAWRWGQK